MRLRVPELLAEHDMTAYELSKRSNGRIGMNAAYRLAKGEFHSVTSDTLDALADVFGLKDKDLGKLLARPSARASGSPS